MVNGTHDSDGHLSEVALRDPEQHAGAASRHLRADVADLVASEDQQFFGAADLASHR